MVSLENIHTNKIIQSEKLIFRNTYEYIHLWIYIDEYNTCNEKSFWSFEREGAFMRRSPVNKCKEEIII